MHSSAWLIVMFIGLTGVTTSPIPTPTTVVQTSPVSLRNVIFSSNSIKLAPGNDANGEQTKVLPSTESQTTIETTTERVESITSDVTATTEPESSAATLMEHFRHVRSVTTEPAYETTAIPFELDFEMLLSVMLTYEHLQGSVEMKLDDLETEADFPFVFDVAIALLNRPVLEANLRQDSAACVNIQNTLVQLVEVLDAFTPYVEAMEISWISVMSLRENIYTLVSPAVIPTSGTHITVVSGTQETIYTLIALRYQIQIIQEVITNIRKC